MTTIKERIKELGTEGDKIIGYSIVGSMLNIICEALGEIEEDELSDAITTIQQKIWDKQKELMNTDIKCD